ncbi:MAG TPA: lipopolysaccharide kinase InaA family protein [Thermodesulfobacteriota bacterium]|nr:lipopolysaccharide kinase InaA family protein [Thermodesulfobacteriota bacterium]
MGKPSFKKISKGEFKGWLRSDLIDALPPLFFQDPVLVIQKLEGRVIKESRLRWAALFCLPAGERLFLKRDKTKGWAEAFKFLLLPSRAKKEWFIACQLQKRNLPIPKPLGWMEKGHWGFVRESYYLSEAIGSGTSLIDLLQAKIDIPFESLAKRVRVFHDAGLFHKDLHGGNFLWDGESFFLTDLHRAGILGSVSLDQRLWNLAHLFHSVRSQWGRKDFLRFLESYFGEEALDLEKKEAYLQKVLSLMEQFQRRWWKSRTKRCLKESTEFSLMKGEGTMVYHRRDLPFDQIKVVVRRHEALVHDKPSDLVKRSPESTVSLFTMRGEGKICVKQFQYPHFIERFKENFRNSKGLKAWIAGNGLIIRDIPSLKVMACVERRDGFGIKESFLLMETSEQGREMDRCLFKGFGEVQRKRLFIKTFAQWLSRLHEKDLYHRDMKTCNILVLEEGRGWQFRLLDLEDVQLDQRVDEKRLFRNFLQLNTSTPRSFTRSDRLRFYREYHSYRPVIQDERRFLSRLIQKSKERGILYVSPQGVIEEKWC